MARAILFVIALIPSLVGAQIVNVELQRLEHDSLGLQGIGEMNLYNVKNTSNILKANGSIQLQLATRRSIYLLVSEAHLILSRSDQLEQEAHGHLRYGYRAGRHLTWEAFAQTQVDQVLKIRNRSLIGSGPKLRIALDSTFECFVGLSAMYEHLEEIGTGIIKDQLRMNSFISAKIKSEERFTIYGIAYFQPLPADFADLRLVGTVAISISASEHLGFTSKISYAYNSRPVQDEDITPLNYKISQGLSYWF